MSKIEERFYTNFGWIFRINRNTFIGLSKLNGESPYLGIFSTDVSNKITKKSDNIANLFRLLEEELSEDRNEFERVGNFEVIEKTKAESASSDPLSTYEESLAVRCQIKELKLNAAGRLT